MLDKDTAGDEAEADDIIDLAPPHTKCLVVEAWENIRWQCSMVMVVAANSAAPNTTLKL